MKQEEKKKQKAMAYVGNTGIGSGVHLDLRGWTDESRTKRMSEERLRELLADIMAGDKPLTEYAITSGYGPRDLRAIVPGASTSHPALDFAIPAGTPLMYTGDYTNIVQMPDQGKAGNVLEIYSPESEIIQLLHLQGFGDIYGRPRPLEVSPAPQQIPYNLPVEPPVMQIPQPVELPAWVGEALKAEEERRRKEMEAESFMGMLKGALGIGSS